MENIVDPYKVKSTVSSSIVDPFESAPKKSEGLVEDFLKPLGKAAVRVPATIVGGLGSSMVGGIAGLGAAATQPVKNILYGTKVDPLTAANTELERWGKKTQYVQTPEEEESLNYIMKVMKPVEMAGEGLAGLTELAATRDLQKATDVIEGRSAGTTAVSKSLIPAAATVGQTSALFGLPTVPKKAVGVKNIVRDVMYEKSGLKGTEGIVKAPEVQPPVKPISDPWLKDRLNEASLQETLRPKEVKPQGTYWDYLDQMGKAERWSAKEAMKDLPEEVRKSYERDFTPELPEGKLDTPAEVELPVPEQLSGFDQLKLETLRDTDPALWSATDKVFMEKLGERAPEPIQGAAEKPELFVPEQYGEAKTPEKLAEAYRPSGKTFKEPTEPPTTFQEVWEAGIETTERPGFTITDKRTFKNILDDVNTTIGKEGKVGEWERSPESLAARERLKEDLKRLTAEAKLAGKDVAQYLKDVGMSDEAMLAFARLQRETRDQKAAEQRGDFVADRSSYVPSRDTRSATGDVSKIDMSAGKESNVVNLITKPTRDFHKTLQNEISEGVKNIQNKVNEYKGWKWEVGDRVKSTKTGNMWEVVGKTWNNQKDVPMYVMKNELAGEKSHFYAEPTKTKDMDIPSVYDGFTKLGTKLEVLKGGKKIIALGEEAEVRAQATLKTPKPKEGLRLKPTAVQKVKDILTGERGSLILGERKPFYSKLEEVINNKMRMSMPVEQLRKTALNNGVTVDEWNDTLGHLSGKVTKRQVLDELAVRGRKFEDVVLGEPDKSYQDILNAEVSRANRYLQQQDKTIREEAARLAAGEPTDIIAFAQMVAEQRNDNYRPTEEYLNKDDAKLPVQFKKYSEPGYKPGSYRELFVTAPRAEALSIRKLQQEYSIAQRKLQSLFESSQYRTPEYASALEEVTRLNKELKEKGVNVPRGDAAFSDWQDGHEAYSSIQNPIVRIRFNERVVGGKGIPPTDLPKGWRLLEDNGVYKVIDSNDYIVEIRDYSKTDTTKADARKSIIETFGDWDNKGGKKVLFVEEIQGPSEANQAKMPESLRNRIYDIGVKRVVSYAKENGFDEIAWTNGKMQADRYNLSKYVDKVSWDNRSMDAGLKGKYRDVDVTPKNEHPISMTVYLDNGEIVSSNRSALQGKKLDEVIGKDIAAKVLKEDTGVLSNLDLEIGGEGLKRLYDEVIPGLMEKYGKGKVNPNSTVTEKASIEYITLKLKDAADMDIFKDTKAIQELNDIAFAIDYGIAPKEALAKYGTTKETFEVYDRVISDAFTQNTNKVSSLPLTEKAPSSFTMYSDPLGFQAGAKALGKVVESAKEGWDKVLERNPTIAKLDEKARTRVEEIYRGIKEGTLDPERVMREDPYAIEVFKNLANAEESKNAFMQKVMPEFLNVTKGIKKGSDSSARIGKVLDGQEGVETLTVKEKKAFDFFKENYDWMINEYARNAAGSEEAYRKILSLVNNKEAKRSRVKDLNPTDRAKYDRLRQIVKEIKGEKKINELDVTTRESYEKASQEARDFLHNDFKKNMSEGERAAYDILSRKLTDYLPHLFDKTELKEMFEADIARIQKKLSKTTNANLITKYKNEIEAIEKAILNIEGGKLVNFRDLPRDVFFRFFAERKGAKGYSFDAVKAFESYVYGIARKIYDEPALRKSYEVYEKVSPELKPYTKELVNHYMGYEPRSRFNNFARFVTTFEWIRTLGLNPRSALVNLTQRLNTAVWVGEKYAAQAQAMMLGSKEMRAKADEIFEKSGVGREIPQVLMEGPVAPSLQGLRSITGVFFDAVERGNRQHALLSGYLKAKAKGMSEEAAIKEGIKIVHKTQFRYGKLGMAKWSRNPGGKLALQFLSYPVKQSQFLYDLYKKDRLAFLRFAAYAIGGNMTLQELLDTDMSNAIGFGITFGEALKAIQFAAEGDTRGAIRHAGQAFTPGGGLLPSGPGPAVASAIAIGKASTQGKGLEQLVKEVTPIMWSRAKQAYKAIKEREGSEYPIFDAKDHMSYRLNARQLAQRTLGPRSEKEHKESLKVREERNLEQERIEITKDIAKKFAEGVLNNDESAIDEAVDLIVKYGIDIGDKQLENEVAARLTTKEERTEPGKKETYQLLREGEMMRDRYNEEED